MNGFKKYIPYVSFWLLNSALIYITNILRPQNFELGTATIPKNVAFLWAGAWLTFIVLTSRYILANLGVKLKERALTFLYYWGANSVVIWVLARLAEYSGFGISRFYWAIALGFVVNVAQWGLWQVLKSYKLLRDKS